MTRLRSRSLSCKWFTTPNYPSQNKLWFTLLQARLSNSWSVTWEQRGLRSRQFGKGKPKLQSWTKSSTSVGRAFGSRLSCRFVIAKRKKPSSRNFFHPNGWNMASTTTMVTGSEWCRSVLISSTWWSSTQLAQTTTLQTTNAECLKAFSLSLIKNEWC